MQSLRVGKALMEAEGNYNQIQEEEQIHRGSAVPKRRDCGSLEAGEVEQLVVDLQVGRGRTILAVLEEEQESQLVVFLPQFRGRLVLVQIPLAS
jgi:hypothetical protein